VKQNRQTVPFVRFGVSHSWGWVQSVPFGPSAPFGPLRPLRPPSARTSATTSAPFGPGISPLSR
jgi:hypothetical protein